MSFSLSFYVDAEAAPDSVILDCPGLVATYEPISCEASVLGGTFVLASIDWGDGTMESFPVTGKGYYSTDTYRE